MTHSEGKLEAQPFQVATSVRKSFWNMMEVLLIENLTTHKNDLNFTKPRKERINTLG